MRRSFLVIFILAGSLLFAQKRTYDLDSLMRIYNDKAQVDTTRMRALQNYAWQTQSTSLDSCLKYGTLLKDYAERTHNELFSGYAENDIATIYKKKTLYAVSMEHAQKALDHWTTVNFEGGMVAALKLMGSIMYNLSNNKRAMEYWDRSLAIAKKINYTEMITSLYLNIGHMYLDSRKDSLALNYFSLARHLLDSIHDIKGVMLDYINVGAVYGNMQLPDSALKYLLMARSIGLELNATEELITIYDNIAYALLEKNRDRNALDSCRVAMRYASHMNVAKDYLMVAQCMQAIFDSLHQPDSAYSYFKQVVIYKDSVNRDNQMGMIRQKETENAFMKKVTADSVQALADRQLSETKLEGEKKTRYFLFGGIFLTMVFATFIFNRLRITQQQKTVIEKQRKEALAAKEIIEEKNREITDSIQYAKRIQQSHLPNEKIIQRNLERLNKKT